jgi:glycine/D-amino acid oxidase-like deaminating enzyme
VTPVTGSGERVLVVGAGVVGLLTAMRFALAGHRVTVLDRGAIPDPGAGSADQHRVLRTLVPNDLDATRRLMAARRRWLDLERRLRTGCFRPVGVLSARGRADAEAALQTAAVAGLPVRRVAGGAFPAAPLHGRVGVLEVQAGVLLAHEVLRAAAGWLAEHPAVQLRPGRAVRAVDADATAVELDGGEVLKADLIVVAAGAWTSALMTSGLMTSGPLPPPVVLHRQTMVYLHPPADLRAWWRQAPAAGGLGPDGKGWAVPPGDGTLLKISSDAVRREVASLDDPEPVDGAAWSARVLRLGLLDRPDRYTVARVRHCHYATTPDGGAQLTRHSPTVWSRAACGGNGFAAAPLVADRITRAALEEAA